MAPSILCPLIEIIICRQDFWPFILSKLQIVTVNHYVYYFERFEPKSPFIGRLKMIVGVNVVLILDQFC